MTAVKEVISEWLERWEPVECEASSEEKTSQNQLSELQRTPRSENAEESNTNKRLEAATGKKSRRDGKRGCP